MTLVIRQLSCVRACIVGCLVIHGPGRRVRDMGEVGRWRWYLMGTWLVGGGDEDEEEEKERAELVGGEKILNATYIVIFVCLF